MTSAARPAAQAPPPAGSPAPATAPAPAQAIGQPHAHESARAHVTGAARYTDDLPEPPAMLHAAPILAPLAHGLLGAVHADAALALPGVRALVLAADVPGDPMFAAPTRDEPVFASGCVQFAGQALVFRFANSCMK